MQASPKVLGLAHVLGWMVLGVGRALSIRPLVAEADWPRLATLKWGGAVLGLLISTLLWVIYQRSFRRPILRKILWGGAPLVAASVWFFADMFALRPLVDQASPAVEWARFPFAMLSNSLLFYSWTGAFLAIRFATESNLRERQTLMAELAADKAQLLALHYQLNPHFLFNALNASRSLVIGAPERAREVIGRLAAFLRYALDTSPQAPTTLHEELEAVQHFAAIYQARFAERIAFVFDVDASVTQCKVPPLFMVPLVENAAQHGSVGSDDILRISVMVRPVDDGVHITISNTGALDARWSPGIGLANVDARLEQAFPGKHRRTMAEDRGWVTVQIELFSDAQDAR